MRDILLGAEPPRFSGRVAQRAIFPTERLRGHAIRDCTKWWGPDRHLLAYFMTRRRDEVYLMGSVPAAAWEGEGLSLPCSREEFIASFAHFHADIRRVVEAATEVTVWPICDRERHDCWSGGRIVLSATPAIRCALHGRGWRHGCRGCSHPQPLPGDDRRRRPRRSLPLLPGDAGTRVGEVQKDLDREQLDARYRRRTGSSVTMPAGRP